MFATDLAMDPVELATEVESRGFHSLYLPEHTHIPVSRLTPPPTGDDELADDYTRTLDPFIALAAAAAVTSTLRLGTGVSLIAQREPLVTAKAIATLSHLSGGRVVLGVGFGWNRDEMEDHGVDYRTRRAHLREHVLAMQALWTDEVASFEGTHVSFPPTWSWPKPPSPVPVLLGGAAGPKLFDHIAEYGNGWVPIGGAGLTASIPRFLGAMADAGRDPDAMEIVPFGTIPDAAKIEHFASIGVTECVFRLPSADRDTVLAALDDQSRFLGK
jgi:probable F420-dependent oxidoreductase